PTCRRGSVVGTEGLEPSRIAPQVPKTCASAISPRPRARNCSTGGGRRATGRSAASTRVPPSRRLPGSLWRATGPPRSSSSWRQPARCGLAPDDRQHLVALLLHQLAALGLQVE